LEREPEKTSEGRSEVREVTGIDSENPDSEEKSLKRGAPSSSVKTTSGEEAITRALSIAEIATLTQEDVKFRQFLEGLLDRSHHAERESTRAHSRKPEKSKSAGSSSGSGKEFKGEKRREKKSETKKSRSSSKIRLGSSEDEEDSE
jgi:hypothetical protein